MYGVPVVFREPSGYAPLAMLMHGQFMRGDSEHAQALCTRTHRRIVKGWGGDGRVHTYGLARSEWVVERVRAQYSPRMIVRIHNATTQLHSVIRVLHLEIHIRTDAKYQHSGSLVKRDLSSALASR